MPPASRPDRSSFCNVEICSLKRMLYLIYYNALRVSSPPPPTLTQLLLALLHLIKIQLPRQHRGDTCLPPLTHNLQGHALLDADSMHCHTRTRGGEKVTERGDAVLYLLAR